MSDLIVLTLVIIMITAIIMTGIIVGKNLQPQCERPVSQLSVIQIKQCLERVK